MDERSLQGLLSQFFPDDNAGSAAQGGEQQTRAVELLRTAAGQAGGPAGAEIDNFLSGRGELLETTRAAAARGGASANNTVAEFLARQLNIPLALAQIIAPLLLNLVPGIGSQPGTGAAARPKPRKKPKPHTTAAHTTAKPAHQAKPKKPKAASSSKPKKPSSSGSQKPPQNQSGAAEPGRSLPASRRSK